MTNFTISKKENLLLICDGFKANHEVVLKISGQSLTIEIKPNRTRKLIIIVEE